MVQEVLEELSKMNVGRWFRGREAPSEGFDGPLITVGGRSGTSGPFEFLLRKYTHLRPWTGLWQVLNDQAEVCYVAHFTRT